MKVIFTRNEECNLKCNQKKYWWIVLSRLHFYPQVSLWFSDLSLWRSNSTSRANREISKFEQNFNFTRKNRISYLSFLRNKILPRISRRFIELCESLLSSQSINFSEFSIKIPLLLLLLWLIRSIFVTFIT